jgi:DNA ligase 1
LLKRHIRVTSGVAALGFQFREGGIYLPELRLWLDPHWPKEELVFVSHAHSDHTADHREVILSEPTARLMSARMGGRRIEHALAYGARHTFQRGGHEFGITLVPAGHIFGSAMSLIECEGESLLYTGDFKLRAGRSAEACQPMHADVLIMETTFGRPHYVFPPAEDVLRGVVRFCREALDNDETAVLYGYSLGKSQEILCSLADAGLPIVLHGSVFNMTKVYEQFGHCFPPYERYEAGQAKGKVVLCPPSVSGSAMLRNLGKTRCAVLTGWAVDPGCRYRYQCDAAFPLSDHADFPALLEFVQMVQPKHVYTLHGFAADFAQTLRAHGFAATALSEGEQMVLGLDVPTGGRRGTRPETGGDLISTAPAHQNLSGALFADFAAACARISSTTSKLQKVELLGAYLASLPALDVPVVAVWFTGLPFAAAENRVIQVGWALLRDALCRLTGVDEATFHQTYLKHSDLGETAAELIADRGVASATPPLLVTEVQECFESLHRARGPSAKLPALLRTLQRCSAAEAKFFVKIITTDLRIGLKEGLVEEAIASAFSGAADDVRHANLLLGHIGETARHALENRLRDVAVQPFRPVKFMLASPEETAAGIWSRLAGETAAESIWLEDKYDGVRCQLHKAEDRVALYSRDLKDITATFHEIAEASRRLPSDVILDGEIMAMRGDAVLPFAELQKRLGRREYDLFLRDEVPLQFVLFDVLWLDGVTRLYDPLRERRRLLEQLALPAGLRLAQITKARSAEEVEAAFQAARARHNEGLMAKAPDSQYSPGRRGLAWLKLKKPLATLDCVVVGAEYGHGKRNKVLSDYTFAVRDTASGELKTIGKAYSGLTDVEIAQLTQHFLSRTIERRGRYHVVRPDTVLEIAFDRIQESQRHSSGLAMRFPRIVRIRSDKTVEEIDSVETARRLLQTPLLECSSQASASATVQIS